MSLLHVEKLQAGYGSAKVLFDICLSVKAGEAVSLMGRNGMGKTTTVKTIMGLIKPFEGKITFKGMDHYLSGSLPDRSGWDWFGARRSSDFPNLDG